MSKRKLAPVISIEAGRVRRYVRNQESGFKQKEQLNWICRCGCWQYEVRPTGVYCLGCGKKQEMVVNPIPG